MYRYYAVPVNRPDGHGLTFNPFDGRCALAGSPHDAFVRLALPATEMLAVWAIREHPALGLVEAGRIASIVPPTHTYVVLSHARLAPLHLDTALDLRVEVGNADPH